MTTADLPEDPRRNRPVTGAALSRRAFVGRAAISGAGAVALSAMPSLTAAAPAPKPAGLTRMAADPTTLVIAMDGSPSDLDPHSAYDYRSVLATLGAYEGLMGSRTTKPTSSSA